MAALPFAARALVGTIPEGALSGTPVTLKEMIEGFLHLVPDVKDRIVNIMQSGATTFVMHCKTTRDVEIMLNAGLTFRGHGIRMVAAPSTQWVKLTRVVYGTTENAIKSRLSEYGTVLKMKPETIHGIGISVYSVKMDIKKPIPSRLSIAHYPVNVFYRGQVQQCFRCEQTGHQSKVCPFKKTVAPPADRIVGPTTETVSTEPASASDPSASMDIVTIENAAPTRTAPDHSVSEEIEEPTRTVSTLPSASGGTTMTTNQEEMSDVSSQESTSTPRTESGKRQRKPDPADDLPAKKRDKSPVPPPSYGEYERETTRIRFLRSSKKATPSEDEDYKEFCGWFPSELLHKYEMTYRFRHPLSWPEDSRTAETFKVYTGFRIPANVFDYSGCEFMQPYTSKPDPAPSMEFIEFEFAMIYEHLRIEYPSYLPSALPKKKEARLKELSDKTHTDYSTFFSFLHPDMRLDIRSSELKLILECIRDRSDIEIKS